MSQNNFVLFGFLTLGPEKERVVNMEGIPYIKAIFESGPAAAGEVHPVLITGESANVAYAEFQIHPNFEACAPKQAGKGRGLHSELK